MRLQCTVQNTLKARSMARCAASCPDANSEGRTICIACLTKVLQSTRLTDSPGLMLFVMNLVMNSNKDLIKAAG